MKRIAIAAMTATVLAGMAFAGGYDNNRGGSLINLNANVLTGDRHGGSAVDLNATVGSNGRGGSLADANATILGGGRGGSAADVNATVGGDNRGRGSLLNLNVGLGGGVGHR